MEKDFVSFWERLPAIYDRFRAMLAERGLGYGGMIIRMAWSLCYQGQRSFLRDFM